MFQPRNPERRLGFGMMRLHRDENNAIDIEQASRLVDRYLEAGFCYFDTAWAYEGTEEAVRKALVERHPREAFLLATKNAGYTSKTKQEAAAQLETSLERSGAGYFDCYLLHNLGRNRSAKYEEYGLWELMSEKKREGILRNIGFSFHGTADELEEILTAHPETDFVQLQLNYIDWESANIQSRACYETARRHNVPIIVMEPVKGGMLANPPQQVAELLKKENPEASYASWAIRFAAGLEGVAMVLSGMNDMSQLEDNISVMDPFVPLSRQEQETIRRAQQELAKLPLVACTGCGYCMDACPGEIAIPASFSAYNMAKMFGREEGLRRQKSMVDGAKKKRAGECLQCGKCEEVCPQHLAIREDLRRVHELLGKE